jgi:NADH-quinone oxidoreductase subunit H
VRTLTQLFAYEVPLFIALLGPALFAGSWSISDIASFYNSHPLYSLLNIPDFAVAIIAAQGKLERVPFDIPEAETEIVAGNFTEYSGRFLAMFRLTTDMEMVTAASLFAAIFIPIYMESYPFLGFLAYAVKVLFIVFILTIIRTLLARVRIEQMVNFCWRYVTPIALMQFFTDLPGSRFSPQYGHSW